MLNHKRMLNVIVVISIVVLLISCALRESSQGSQSNAEVASTSTDVSKVPYHTGQMNYGGIGFGTSSGVSRYYRHWATFVEGVEHAYIHCNPSAGSIGGALNRGAGFEGCRPIFYTDSAILDINHGATLRVLTSNVVGKASASQCTAAPDESLGEYAAYDSVRTEQYFYHYGQPTTTLSYRNRIGGPLYNLHRCVGLETNTDVGSNVAATVSTSAGMASGEYLVLAPTSNSSCINPCEVVVISSIVDGTHIILKSVINPHSSVAFAGYDDSVVGAIGNPVVQAWWKRYITTAGRSSGLQLAWFPIIDSDNGGGNLLSATYTYAGRASCNNAPCVYAHDQAGNCCVEFRNDSQLQATRRSFVAAMQPYTVFLANNSNFYNVSPKLPNGGAASGIDAIFENLHFETGDICEHCVADNLRGSCNDTHDPVDYACSAYWAWNLNSTSVLSAQTGERHWIVNDNEPYVSSAVQRGMREMQLAICWLAYDGFKDQNCIAWESNSNLPTEVGLMPEYSIVPTQPVQSMKEYIGTSDPSCTECHGAQDLEVASGQGFMDNHVGLYYGHRAGVWRREYEACYRSDPEERTRSPIGPCAVVLNATNNRNGAEGGPVPISGSWFKHSYKHRLSIGLGNANGDVANGGTVSLSKLTFSFGNPGVCDFAETNAICGKVDGDGAVILLQ